MPQSHSWWCFVASADALAAGLPPPALELDRVGVANELGLPLLMRIRFTVQAGEAVAVVGRNGSGKSTLLRVIAGLSAPRSGTVRISGEDLFALGYHAVQRARTRVGLVFERGGIWANRTIESNISLPLEYHHPELDVRVPVRQLAEELGIDGSLNRPATEADASVQRRTLLARALVMQPALLLFDEPQHSLTPDEARPVCEAIERRRAQQHLTVIYTDHDGQIDPFVVDRCVYLAHGQLTNQPPADQRFSIA
jgi:ABC-type lipoprotein export system ATPase subunit